MHRGYPALHRTLPDLPNPEETKATYDAVRQGYLHRCALIVAACRGRGLCKSDGPTAQVLSSAAEGMIHNAARRGMPTHPQMKREFAELARGYLENDRVAAAKMK